MVSRVSVKTDIEKLPKSLRAFADQIPFATQSALNNTAFAVRKDIQQNQLPRFFTIRNRHTARGIRVDKATKYNLTAEVGSIDWYIDGNVVGDTRRPNKGIKVNGKSYLAVPTKAIIRSKNGSIRKAQRAARLLFGSSNTYPSRGGQRKGANKGNKRTPFVTKLKNGTLVIARRKGKKQRPLEILYILTPITKYKKRWPFESQNNKIIKQKFPREFKKAMVRAARTAKR